MSAFLRAIVVWHDTIRITRTRLPINFTFGKWCTSEWPIVLLGNINRSENFVCVDNQLQHVALFCFALHLQSWIVRTVSTKRATILSQSRRWQSALFRRAPAHWCSTSTADQSGRYRATRARSTSPILRTKLQVRFGFDLYIFQYFVCICFWNARLMMRVQWQFYVYAMQWCLDAPKIMKPGFTFEMFMFQENTKLRNWGKVLPSLRESRFQVQGYGAGALLYPAVHWYLPFTVCSYFYIAYWSVNFPHVAWIACLD